MEDLGDILFYIIAAVIGLATTLGRKKKKPAGVPFPAETEEEVEIDYQVEDEDYTEDQPIPERERIVSYEPTYNYSFDPGLEGNYNEPLTDEFAREDKPEFIAGENNTENEVPGEIEEEEDIVSDFDLRQAVIFSEILKRNDY
jgi:hypothetical protein